MQKHERISLHPGANGISLILGYHFALLRFTEVTYDTFCLYLRNVSALISRSRRDSMHRASVSHRIDNKYQSKVQKTFSFLQPFLNISSVKFNQVYPGFHVRFILTCAYRWFTPFFVVARRGFHLKLHRVALSCGKIIRDSLLICSRLWFRWCYLRISRSRVATCNVEFDRQSMAIRGSAKSVSGFASSTASCDHPVTYVSCFTVAR